jgi:hypothetical protein
MPKVLLKEGKALESENGKVLECGPCYEQGRKIDQ